MKNCLYILNIIALVFLTCNLYSQNDINHDFYYNNKDKQFNFDSFKLVTPLSDSIDVIVFMFSPYRIDKEGKQNSLCVKCKEYSDKLIEFGNDYKIKKHIRINIIKFDVDKPSTSMDIFVKLNNGKTITINRSYPFFLVGSNRNLFPFENIKKITDDSTLIDSEIQKNYRNYTFINSRTYDNIDFIFNKTFISDLNNYDNESSLKVNRLQTKTQNYIDFNYYFGCNYLASKTISNSIFNSIDYKLKPGIYNAFSLNYTCYFNKKKNKINSAINNNKKPENIKNKTVKKRGWLPSDNSNKIKLKNLFNIFERKKTKTDVSGKEDKNNCGWGITTGVGISYNLLDIQINSIKYTDNQVDINGTSYQRKISLDNVNEQIVQKSVILPILLHYNSPNNFHRRIIFTSDAGVDLSLPLEQDNNILRGNYTTTGYYDKYNVTISDIGKYGFYNNAKIINYNKINENKVYVFTQLNLGCLYNFSNNISSGFTLFGFYNLNNSINPVNKILLDNNNNYNSLLNNIKSNNILIYGIIFKILFKI